MLSIEITYNSENKSIVSTRLRKTFGMVRKNYTYDNYPKNTINILNVFQKFIG